MKTKTIQVLGLVSLFLSLSASVIALANTRRSQRRWGVRPINRRRDTEGLYATLIKDMSMLDEEQFFKYTRMTVKQFNNLFKLVCSNRQRHKNKLKISQKQRLMITIHFLSEGCSMQEIAWGYRIGETTVIKETCKLIWDILQPIELPEPTMNDFENIGKGFYDRWNLPNCIGAVDGKHINIMAPKKSGSVFYNYKKTFSIVLMATCDAYYRFTMIDVGAAGSNHDSAVFKASGLGSALFNGELCIPPPKPLTQTNILFPHFVVGDAAFPLHKNIIRPYPGAFLDEKKNIFNYRISRARRCIENTFGILSQRWMILRTTINASLEVTEAIVLATVVLHNYLQNSEKDIPPGEQRYCPTGYTDHFDESGVMHEGEWRKQGQNLRSVTKLASNNYTRSAKNYRDILADFFISKAGWVPWQEEYVNRGLVP